MPGDAVRLLHLAFRIERTDENLQSSGFFEEFHPGNKFSGQARGLRGARRRYFPEVTAATRLEKQEGRPEGRPLFDQSVPTFRCYGM
jgi:hypothetical protein